MSREEIPCRSGLEALDGLHMKYSGLRYICCWAGETTAIGLVYALRCMKRRDSMTPVTFSREELRTIRESFGSGGTPPVCPVCGGLLKVVGPAGGDKGPTVWQIECEPCRRAAFISMP